MKILLEDVEVSIVDFPGDTLGLRATDANGTTMMFEMGRDEMIEMAIDILKLTEIVVEDEGEEEDEEEYELYDCPHCNAELEIFEDDHKSEDIECPNCNELFTIE